MPKPHDPPTTRVAHRFYEFILFADTWGLHAQEFADEHTAAEQARTVRKDYLFVADWNQFRMQSPVKVPHDIVNAFMLCFDRTKKG